MIIVSGLARTGTSLMMSMLEAGGIKPYTDGAREADINNIHGYREVHEIGKKLEADGQFLSDKEGCCKVLSPFLRHLQGGHRIVYMERDLGEVAASMRKMSGKPVTPRQQLLLRKHVEGTKNYLKGRDVIYVNYNNLVINPREETEQLQTFLPELDLDAALKVIDSTQYRNRK